MEENHPPLLDNDDADGISFATDNNASGIDDPFAGNDLTTDTDEKLWTTWINLLILLLAPASFKSKLHHFGPQWMPSI